MIHYSVQSSEDLDCVLARKRRKLSRKQEAQLVTTSSSMFIAIVNVNYFTQLPVFAGSAEKMSGTAKLHVTSHQSLQEYFSAKLDATRNNTLFDNSSN